MLSITRQISNYNFSSGNDIKYIVIHATGNTTDTASGNANYFNGGDRQASAHYFVDSNSIYQVVEDYNASWHCGDGHMAYGIGNHNSIGIEMCETNGTITDATINNTLDLVRFLMDKYGVSIQNIVRHYDASRKCCPEPWSTNNWAKWNEFKSMLTNGVSTSDTPISITKDIELKSMISALQWDLNSDYNAKLKHIDGNIYQETLDALNGIKGLLVKEHKSSTVLWLKQRMIRWGYCKYTGAMTNEFDEILFQGITNLQKNWNRATSGILNLETWSVFLNNK